MSVKKKKIYFGNDLVPIISQLKSNTIILLKVSLQQKFVYTKDQNRLIYYEEMDL